MKKLKSAIALALISTGLVTVAAQPAEAAKSYPYFRCQVGSPTYLGNNKWRFFTNSTNTTWRNEFWYKTSTKEKRRLRPDRYHTYVFNNAQQTGLYTILGKPYRIESRQSAYWGQNPASGRSCMVRYL